MTLAPIILFILSSVQIDNILHIHYTIVSFNIWLKKVK